MSLLFFVDKNKTAILHPEVVKLMPSLSILNDQEILFIILYADYNSPYRQFPERDRRNKAMWHAFDDNEYDLIESSKMQAAIDDYIALQYSPKIKAAEDYQKKMDSLLTELQDANGPKELKNIDDAIDVCRKRIEMFQKEYEMDMQKQGIVKGKMELSFLEKLMSNAKQYKAVINQEVKLKT